MLGYLPVLGGAERYSSRNPIKLSVYLIEYGRHFFIFSNWDISRDELIISVQFRQLVIIFVSSSLNFLLSPTWRLFSESSRQYGNFSRHGA